MLNIQGNSGCQLKLFTSNDKQYLRKITSDKVYIHRLKKQALKK